MKTAKNAKRLTQKLYGQTAWNTANFVRKLAKLETCGVAVERKRTSYGGRHTKVTSISRIYLVVT